MTPAPVTVTFDVTEDLKRTVQQFVHQTEVLRKAVALLAAGGNQLTAMVAEFHAAFQLPGDPGGPTLYDSRGRRELRRKLLREEFEEYMLGEETNDIVEIADALGDMAYIIWGTALEYGIPLDKVIAEIHRSNMSKLNGDGKPLMREDGKVLKSALYTPPDIAKILGR